MGCPTVLKQKLPSSRANGEMQMADLRKFKSELDGATKITETGLQKSVFECVVEETRTLRKGHSD